LPPLSLSYTMQVSTSPREVFDIRFQHPATHYVSGPSSSGKTFRILNLLRMKDVAFVNGQDIKNIVIYYDSWQEAYDKIKRDCHVNHFINKMPTVEEFVQVTRPYKNKGGSLVIIDDMLSKINEDLDHIFRVAGRHNCASVFVLFQSLFPPHKMGRQISLNSKYFHLFRNPRETGQISYFARQVKPSNIRFVTDAFVDATKKPYESLLVDCTQECDDRIRYRTRYMNKYAHTIVYLEK